MAAERCLSVESTVFQCLGAVLIEHLINLGYELEPQVTSFTCFLSELFLLVDRECKEMLRAINYAHSACAVRTGMGKVGSGASRARH